MKTFLLTLLTLLAIPTLFAEPPPEKALRYHAALLSRSDNATLFDRFYNAWLDELPLESLETYLQSQADEKGGQNLAILARYHLRRGQEPQALNALGKAITALPKDPTLPLERGKILLSQLDFAAARQDFTTVTKNAPPALALEAARLIGKSYLREGKPAEAIVTWDKLLAAHPGDQDLLEDLVESAAAGGQNDQAIAYAKKLIASTVEPYQKTLRQLRLGELQAQAGQSDDAIKTLTQTLAQVGEGSWLESEILAQFQKTFTREDRLDDLRTQLTKLAQENPRRHLIHRQLAHLEAADGDLDSAIGRFRTILRRSPGDTNLREEFIRLLTDSERYADAAEELQKLIELDPKNPELYLRLAALHDAQENPADTLKTLQKVAELAATDEPTSIRIAKLLIQYDYAEKGEILLKNLASRPKATTAPAEALAVEYTRSKRPEPALALLTDLAKSATELEPILRFTSAISSLGHPAEAEKILSAQQKNFSQNPRFSTAFIQTAITAKLPEKALPTALQLVGKSTLLPEILDNTDLAQRLLAAAEKSEEIRQSLAAKKSLTLGETCLLATLTPAKEDPAALTPIFADTTDPTLIRFHAQLLENLNHLPEALVQLQKLAPTPEGQKASFYKDLTQLQIRSAQVPDALATLKKWQQSAPGDLTPWLTTIRLHQSSGQLPEAIATARQATARFPENIDLAATLASLHTSTGNPAEAEKILWQLYNDAESPADASRWAAQLSQIATSTKRVPQLQEKFQERARSNRRSLGPILAQIELARLTGDAVAQRDLLQEALRLKPAETSLRMQLSALEEAAGNPEQATRVIEEGIPLEKTDTKLRHALAQLFIRQGHTLKGLRLLHALSGKEADDPRAGESTALSLAQNSLFDEAITYLQQTLPSGGDWRTKYLLATLLQHDGREAEAFPIFLALYSEKEEISASTPQAPNANVINLNGRSYLQLPQGNLMPVRQDPNANLSPAESLRQLVQIISQIQNQNQYRNSSNQNPFQQSPIPATLTQAHSFIEITLIELAAGNPEKISQLASAGLENTVLITDLLATSSRNGVDFPALLKKHPDYPGLLETTIAYGNNRSDNTELFHEIAQDTKISPALRLRAALLPIYSEKPANTDWNEFINLSKAALTESDETTVIQNFSQVLSLLSRRPTPIPDDSRQELQAILAENIEKLPAENPSTTQLRYSFYQITGNQPLWIESLNQIIAEHQKNIAALNAQRLQSQLSINRSPWSGNSYPQITLDIFQALPLTTIPYRQIYSITSEKTPRADNSIPRFTAESLLKSLNSIKSPVLRAHIALMAENPEAFEKILASETTPEEKTDLNLIQIVDIARQKDYLSACELILATRTASEKNSPILEWLDTALLSAASEIPAEKRPELAPELIAALERLQKAYPPQVAQIFAQTALKLGLTDLAKKITATFNAANGRTPTAQSKSTTLGPATFAPSRIQRAKTSPRNQALNPQQRIQKFIAEEKPAAAARETLAYLQTQSRNQNSIQDTLRQFQEILTPEVRQEILKRAAPGDTRSLSKRLQFIDLAEALGSPELALPILETLAAERPDDVTISTRLAFALPATESERAQKLLARAMQSPEITAATRLITTRLQYKREGENSTTFAVFNLIADTLANTPPATFENSDLSWIFAQALNFYQGSYTSNITAIFNQAREIPKEQLAATKKYHATADHLARAMLLHPSIAEEAFQFLSWKPLTSNQPSPKSSQSLTPAEIDLIARQSYLAGQRPIPKTNQRQSFRSNSGNLQNATNSAQHLANRLNETKNPEDILPAKYLEELALKNPPAATLFTALKNMKSVESLTALWDQYQEITTTSPVEKMFREAILTRAASLPNATTFFLDRLREIPIAKIRESQNNGNNGEYNTALQLSQAAFATATPEQIPTVCKTIGLMLFGGKIDWENQTPENVLTISYGAEFMSQILSKIDQSPQTSLQIVRSLKTLGYPTNNSTDWLETSFRKEKYQTPQEVTAAMNELGFLNKIQDWKPFTAFTYINVRKDNGNVSQPFEKFILDDIAREMQRSARDQDFSKILLEKKPPTFGALITAAAISSSQSRAKYTSQAFAEAKSYLASATPKRRQEFTILLPWLPRDAYPTLHPDFQKLLKEEDRKKLDELLARADEYKKSNLTNNPPQPFYNLNSVIPQIGKLDLEKAADLFLEAEAEFTTSLTQGSNVASQNNVVTYRDSVFRSILYSNSAESLAELENKFELYHRITHADAGKRLSLSSASDGRPILSDIGLNWRRLIENENSSSHDTYLGYMKTAMTFPENLRHEALISITLHEIHYNSQSNPENSRAELSKKENLSDLIKNLSLIAIGTPQWSKDTPKGQGITAAALEKILTDQTIDEFARIQLALGCATQFSDILKDPKIANLIAVQFEFYCAADRSAINPLSLQLLLNLSKIEPTPESLPALQRINAAFWKNANAKKPAGHPAIPTEYLQHLFLAALNVNDDETSQELLPEVKNTLTGDLQFIVNCLNQSQYEIAAALLPENAAEFTNVNLPSAQSPKLQDAISNFEKTNPDPQKFLRLKIHLLYNLLYNQNRRYNENSIKEISAAIDAFKKLIPPENPLHRELLAYLISTNPLVAIQLEKEIALVSKNLDPRDTFEAYLNMKNISHELSSHQIDVILLLKHAMLETRNGNSKPFTEFCTTLQEIIINANQENSGYQNPHLVRNIYAQLNEANKFWVWFSIAKNNTAVLKEILHAYYGFWKNPDDHKLLESYNNDILPIGYLLAIWADETDQFFQAAKLANPSKSEVNEIEKYQTHQLSRLFFRQLETPIWEEPEFKALKKNLLIQSLKRPKFIESFKNGDSDPIEILSGNGFESELKLLTPDDLKEAPPISRSQVYLYQGRRHASADEKEKAIEKFRLSLKELPNTPELAQNKSITQVSLVAALCALEKNDEATKIFQTINPEALPKHWQPEYNRQHNKLTPEPAAKK